MATAKKTASKAKPATKKSGTAKRRGTSSDVDRRWSLLLFVLGVLFILMAFVPGASGWAWMRENLLFGAFGISSWLLGPFFLYWAVLVGLKKRVFSPVIRCILFMIALSGAALVFSKQVFTDPAFGEILEILLDTGKNGSFGGGLLSLLFGYPLLAFCGRPVANILIVLVVMITVMVVTRVTPGDIFRFFADLWARRPQREYNDEEADDFERADLLEEPARPPVVRQKPPAKPRKKKKPVDIDLGPDAPHSEPGLGAQKDVEIGPGGTFGMNPLGEEAPPVVKEEPLLPFDPYSRQSLYDNGAGEGKPDVLLFGADDPYAHTGAADVESLFEPIEEELPQEVPWQQEPEPVPTAGGQETAFMGAISAEDLFGRTTSVPSPVQFPKKGDTAFAGETGGEPTADPNVDALIARAAAAKPEGEQAADNRPAPDAFEPYHYPPATLFSVAGNPNDAGAREEMRKTADLLVSTLASFGVQTRILDVSRGPSVTRYEIQPQTGVKISRITNLSDDIALNLAAAGVRIEAPIPGKPAVGIEVPNKLKSTVSIRSILESPAFATNSSPLTIALGKDIAGDSVVADLTKMPHLLVAGSTGSGKSVCINSIIMSIVYKSSPEDVRLMLIDPKVVELAEYNGVPHLLMPVVTEPRKAAGALGQMVAEMEKRYRLFAENNVRDIKTYNKLAARRGEMEKLPYIAIIIDELADLMMTSGKEVEDYICRIAQKARAAGMHLIVATQRPSVDVITGLIKANIPSRIAFAVSSQVDSRTILDGAGAEKLLGMGDMLFMPVGANKPVRVQGTYVKDKEISSVIRYIKQNSNGSRYDEDFIAQVESRLKGDGSGDSGGASSASDVFADPTFQQAVEVALDQGQISTSFLQRRLRLGYARAGRIMDEMEQHGIISPPEGSKPRQVLVSRQQWLEMSMNASD